MQIKFVKCAIRQLATKRLDIGEHCEVYIFLDFNFSPSIFLRLGVPGENLRPGDEVRLMRCIATDSLEMPAYGVLQLLGDNSKVRLAVILFSRIFCKMLTGLERSKFSILFRILLKTFFNNDRSYFNFSKILFCLLIIRVARS